MKKRDEKFLNVFANKGILAWVMKGLVKEYRNYDISEIIEFIHDDIHINNDKKISECDIEFHVDLPNCNKKVDVYLNVVDVQEDQMDIIIKNLIYDSFNQTYKKKLNKKVVVWILNNVEEKYANTVSMLQLQSVCSLGNLENKVLDDMIIYMLGMNDAYKIQFEDVIDILK